jgi:signal peptide peptidase SppA
MNTSPNAVPYDLLDKPLALAPERMEWVNATLKAMAADETCQKLMAVSALGSNANSNFWYGPDDWESQHQPYSVSSDGVLTVPVSGILVGDLPFCLDGWMTGYDYIQAALARGAADPDVKGIMLAIDSPGGEASGMEETANAVKAVSSVKPITAYAKNATSAAYGVASGADTISAAKFGMFANIGVVRQRADISESLAQQGVKINLIQAGANKTDGYSSQPMTDGERARIQASVDDIYAEFTSMVAKNRNMDVQAIRDTEASTYDAKNAMAHGLVDSIATPSEAMANFVSTIDERMAGMATDNQAAIDAAVNAARAEERGIATTAARTRISAILACAEAKDRPKLAQHIALNTDQSVEEAQGILAASAVETAPVAATPAPAAAPAAVAPAGQAPFAVAMVATGNPNVGAEAVSAAAAPQKSRAQAAMDIRYGATK